MYSNSDRVRFRLDENTPEDILLQVFNYIKPKDELLQGASKRFTNAGIYGIFNIDRRKKNKIGKCLYIGQSINLERRLGEHKTNIKKARKQINGIRQHRKFYLSSVKNPLEWKYYAISKQYKLADLIFLVLIPCEPDLVLLTYLEQFCIDNFEPKYNTRPAEITRFGGTYEL